MKVSKKKAKNHLNDNKQIFIVRMLDLGRIIFNSSRILLDNWCNSIRKTSYIFEQELISNFKN